MYNTDFSNVGFLYEERLRDAEQHRAHNKLVQSALARRKALGEVGFLSQLAQRLHIKAQPQADARDSRRAHAV